MGENFNLIHYHVHSSSLKHSSYNRLSYFSKSFLLIIFGQKYIYISIRRFFFRSRPLTTQYRMLLTSSSAECELNSGFQAKLLFLLRKLPLFHQEKYSFLNSQTSNFLTHMFSYRNNVFISHTTKIIDYYQHRWFIKFVPNFIRMN